MLNTLRFAAAPTC